MTDCIRAFISSKLLSSSIKFAPFALIRRRLPTALIPLRRHKFQLLSLSKPLPLPPLILSNQALNIAILRPPRRHRQLRRQRTLIAILLRNLRKSHQLRQQARIAQRSRILQALVEMHTLLFQFEEPLELLRDGRERRCFFAVLRGRRRRVGDVEVGDWGHGEFAEALAGEGVG